MGHTWEGGLRFAWKRLIVRRGVPLDEQQRLDPLHDQSRVRARAEYFFDANIGVEGEWLRDKYGEQPAFDQAGPLADYNGNRIGFFSTGGRDRLRFAGRISQQRRTSMKNSGLASGSIAVLLFWGGWIAFSGTSSADMEHPEAGQGRRRDVQGLHDLPRRQAAEEEMPTSSTTPASGSWRRRTSARRPRRSTAPGSRTTPARSERVASRPAAARPASAAAPRTRGSFGVPAAARLGRHDERVDPGRRARLRAPQSRSAPGRLAAIRRRGVTTISKALLFGSILVLPDHRRVPRHRARDAASR